MPTPYESLYNDLAFALLAGKPETLVQTPGYTPVQHTAEQVVSDAMAGEGSTSLADLLRIVAQAASGKPVKVAAQAWIDRQCSVHAAFHCGDVEDEQDDGADAWHDARREREAFGVAA